MSSFERGAFELRLSESAVEPHLVIVADVGYSREGGGYVRFRAQRRGLILGESAPDDLAGAQYIQEVGRGVSFYALQLRSGGDEDGRSGLRMMLADQLDALGKDQLTGESARSAVWALFWHLVVTNPDCSFIDELDCEWLSKLRREALAQIS